MRNSLGIVSVAALVALAACSPSTETPMAGASDTVVPVGNVSLNKSDYPVFLDADAGADPAVPPEEGGRGFTGEGWTTNTDFDFIGDPRAAQGGILREAITDFPGTLRIEGPESNTALNSKLTGMVYETLLGLHPTTLEYIPGLATHWQVSDDRMTFRYRIDPNARWSDGRPVTAEDVVATWSFEMDPGLQAPMAYTVWEKFEKPVAESQYIVSVRSSRVNWRNFLYFSVSLPIFPAHVLKDVDGETYVRDYNFKMLPGSGPYRVREEEVNKGKSITIRKREDYWAAGHRRNVGLANLDEIREIVVRNRNLEFEMFKKGDLDYHYVNRAQMWVEDLDFDRIQRGLIQKRKIFNHGPNGVQGLAFNTRKPPFDDVRVRKALAHLFNRELLIEKLMYNEYQPQNSYYAGSVYENADNPKITYDPEHALELLAEAGWKDRDANGRLVKSGTPLAIAILYWNKASEKFFTVYQEDLRKVGINLSLRLVTPETGFKLVMERQFDVVSMGWGGLTFPNPETSYRSDLADQNNTNNITGVQHPRIDEICDAYDRMFEMEDRIEAIREIDGILASLHHYILEWYAPYHRIVYWNKFGHPKGYISRIGDYRDLPTMWWIDPEKLERLEEALRDPSIQLEVGPTNDRYWLEFERIEERMHAEPRKTQ